MTVSSERARDSKLRTKVFISYSRKDMAFADRLEAEMTARGFAPLIDRTEIYAFEDWWRRIQGLVSQADIIVFVLSPDAVASDVCRREIAFAASLNKRLAPIVYRRPDDKAVPDELRRLNFIFFDDATQFDASLAKLTAALETDIDWIRMHTEFGQIERRWDLAGRPGGLLLRSPMLEQAERWIASRPPDAPAPTDATRAFIALSRQAATNRRNILTGSLAAGLLLALGLAAAAYWQRGLAIDQRNEALLTQSRFLADLANQNTRVDDADSGMLLALEALPDKRGGVDRPYAPEAEVALFSARQRLKEVAILSGHEDRVWRATFSPDGRRVVTSSDDKTARIWDIDTERTLVVLRGHDAKVTYAVFSPDGRRVATVSDDKTARIWDPETGNMIATLAGHSDVVTGAAFSPDGRLIATCSFDKTAHRHAVRRRAAFAASQGGTRKGSRASDNSTQDAS
jgi:TIR domain/WD domain, G-beta repeat